MSIRVMSRVWDDPSITDRAELLVLLALADWANDRGECDPSYGQLARKARITRRYAIDVVARLVEDGTLQRVVGAGFTYARGAVSNRLILVKHASPGEPQFTTPSEPRSTRVVKPSSPGVVKPSSPTTVNNNDQPLLPSATDSPFGVVVVAPSPAPPDHDDDAQDGRGPGLLPQGHEQDQEALAVVASLLAASHPGREIVRQAPAVLADIRRLAKSVTADDIQAAADAWEERWERIKGCPPDPITANQLPEVVAAWARVKGRGSGRTRHGIVPHIEY